MPQPTPNRLDGWTSHPLDGWTPHPRSLPSLLPPGRKNVKDPEPMKVGSVGMEIPDTQLVKEVMAYAERELSVETLNHSMRVYYWGEYD